MVDFQRIFEVPKNDFIDAKLNMFVHFKKHEKTLLIKVLDQTNNSAWQCELNDKSARQYYNVFEMSPDDYWEDIEQPMKSVSSSYQYWLHADKFSLKKLVDSNVVLEFFKLPLTQLSSDDLKSLMLTKLIEITANLETQNKKLLEENEKLKTQSDSFSRDLDTLVQTKSQMEDEMLSKFVQLLNTKKEKIAQLEMKIHSKRRKVPEDSEMEVEVDEHDTDEDNAAYDQDTDKEEEDKPTEQPQNKSSTSFSGLMDM